MAAIFCETIFKPFKWCAECTEASCVRCSECTNICCEKFGECGAQTCGCFGESITSMCRCLAAGFSSCCNFCGRAFSGCCTCLAQLLKGTAGCIDNLCYRPFSTCLCFSICINLLPMIMAGVWISDEWSTTCDQPLHIWLIVSAILYIINMLFGVYVFYKASASAENALTTSATRAKQFFMYDVGVAMYICIGIFVLVWSLLGLSWSYSVDMATCTPGMITSSQLGSSLLLAFITVGMLLLLCTFWAGHFEYCCETITCSKFLCCCLYYPFFYEGPPDAWMRRIDRNSFEEANQQPANGQEHSRQKQEFDEIEVPLYTIAPVEEARATQVVGGVAQEENEKFRQQQEERYRELQEQARESQKRQQEEKRYIALQEQARESQKRQQEEERYIALQEARESQERTLQEQKTRELQEPRPSTHVPAESTAIFFNPQVDEEEAVNVDQKEAVRAEEKESTWGKAIDVAHVGAQVGFSVAKMGFGFAKSKWAGRQKKQ